MKLIRELQGYSRDRKVNDHAIDSLRYALANHHVLKSGEISISFGVRPR